MTPTPEQRAKAVLRRLHQKRLIVTGHTEGDADAPILACLTTEFRRLDDARRATIKKHSKTARLTPKESS